MQYLKSILLFLFAFAFVLLEAQGAFYVKGASTTNVGANYKIIFILENLEGSDFRPPSFDGFDIAYGPEQGSSYSWVNGKTSQSISIAYYLKAKEEGTLTIGSASVKANGEIWETKELEVTVGAANQPKKENNLSNWEDKAQEDIFVKLYTDNTSPYVGQQIFAYAKLYQKVNIYNLQATKYPDYNGFWKQEIETDPEAHEMEVINGKQYMTRIVAKSALFPQRAGEFTIQPFEFYSVILAQEPVVQSFGGMQFQTYLQKQVEYEFQSNALKIEVKALPEVNKPLNFGGAVGKFKIENTIDSTEINLGSPLNLLTKITGTGNLMMLDEPYFEFPKNFDVFDPEIKENISKKSNYVNGNIKYHYILVPQKPGSFVLPSYNFSYFDLETDSYKTLETPSINIRVKGELAPIITTPLESEIVADINSDEPRSLHKQYDFKNSGNSFYGSSSYYLAMASPFALMSLLFVFLRFKENNPIDLVALKNKRASKVAQKRLKKAKLFLDKKDKKGFYTEIFDGLNNYVSDKLDLSQAEMNKELILQKFKEKEISADLAGQFSSLIINSEEALYSPASQSKMQEDFDIALKWIVDIENEMD